MFSDHKKSGGNKYNRMLDEVAHGKHELPPLWVDIQESIEDKIKDVDDKCTLYTMIIITIVERLQGLR